MQEMEKLQAKGELGEAELRALEIDVTGRVMQPLYQVQICLPDLETVDHVGFVAWNKI